MCNVSVSESEELSTNIMQLYGLTVLLNANHKALFPNLNTQDEEIEIKLLD